MVGHSNIARATGKGTRQARKQQDDFALHGTKELLESALELLL